jgi:hypothetical protein
MDLTYRSRNIVVLHKKLCLLRYVQHIKSHSIFDLHKKCCYHYKFNILSLTALCRSNSSSNVKLVEGKVVILIITLMFKLITLILVYIIL